MLELLKKTFSEFADDNCSRIAAALSYFTVFSLPPLLTLAIFVGGMMFDPEDVSGKIEAQVASLVGQDGATQIRTIIAAADRPALGSIAGIASIAILVIGAIGLVGQLQGAMNEVWDVKPDPEKSGIKSLIMTRVFSFGMLVAGLFLLLVSLILSTLIAAFGDWLGTWLPGNLSEGVLQLINTILAFVVTTGLFAAMFRFLPDAKIAWRDVFVGAIVTSALFSIGKFAIGLYLGSRNMDSMYGAAGSLALILVWIYYSSIIFLLGAEFTQVWSRLRGEGIEPSNHAVRANNKLMDDIEKA